jgi:hypothetical protein
MRALVIARSIQRFPEEAIYVYSLKEDKMVFAAGWEEVPGYEWERFLL